MQLRTNKGPVINANDYLQVGDYLFTVNPAQPYSYLAVLQPSGDLEFWYGAPANPQLGTGPSLSYFSQLNDAPGHVYKDPGYTFNPASSGDYFAIMQTDGNFCVYRGTDPAHNQGFCWSTNTYGKGTAPYAAVLDTGGNLQVGGGASGTSVQATWSTGLSYPGQRVVTGSQLTSGQWMAGNDTLVAGQGAYIAWLEHTGEFALACGEPPGRPVVLPPGSPGGSETQVYWAATANQPGLVIGTRQGGAYFATMQGDGNFCLYNGSNPGHNKGVYWALSSTARAPGSYVAQLHDDGTFTVGAAGAAVYWATATVTDPNAIIFTRINDGQYVYPPVGDTNWVQFPNPLGLRAVRQSLVPVANAGVHFQVDEWTTYDRVENGQLLGVDEALLEFGNPTQAQGMTGTYGTKTDAQGYAYTGQVFGQWVDDWLATWALSAWISGQGTLYGLYMSKQPTVYPPSG